MKNNKKSQPRNWHYLSKKPSAVLTIYCLLTVMASLLTAAAAAAGEGGKTLLGGVFLLAAFYCRETVDRYYDGLDGIPALLVRATGFWALVLGISFICSGLLIIFLAGVTK